MKNTVHLSTALLITFLALAFSVPGPVRGEAPARGAFTPAKPERQILIPPKWGTIGEAGPTPADAAPVPYNSTIDAYIDRNDCDTFLFGFPGGKMRISSRWDLDIVADLLDCDGNLIARDGQDTKKDFSIEKELPEGMYYIQIRYMYHAGEGPYTLILGDGNAARLKEASLRT